ncbi:Probable LRR receptor-like serine/threonine-protein kinase At1g67720 [Linum perenne]
MVLLLSMFTHFLLLSLLLVSPALSQVSEFVSIDCGGTSNYSDSRTGLEWVSDATMMSSGKSVEIQNPDGNLEQYKRRRDFPIDSSKKYCYNLATRERRRYLIRATFQYGNLGNQDAYPKFDLYLDATKWSTVTILESSRVYVKEMIIRAPSTSVDVCICCATTGSPFISTLELRPLNLSMYATDFEGSFFLKVAARMNFGASNKDAIRYPDDPYDRIWDSDLDRRQNYLVGVAPGTMRINTTKDIWVSTREYPPVKVMQTAVVGTEGTLSYRLNLEDFPANARAYAYFAEIEDLGSNETRKFKLTQPYFADYSNAVVNIMENGNGSNSLYEPSYMNVSLEFVLSFSFVKTRDSTRGPLLNAMEISKYLQIAAKTDSQDLNVLNIFRSMAPGSSWTSDGGDPCVPAHWEWVTCGITSPPRITKMYIQNNALTGNIPPALLNGKVIINYEHNPGLHKDTEKKLHFKLVLGISIGILAALSLLLLASLVFLQRLRRKNSTRTTTNDQDLPGHSMRTSAKPSSAYSVSRGWHLTEDGISYYIPLSKIEGATNNFSKKIGKGSFGTVYYGQMEDGKEVAVKIMADSCTNLTQQFVTEVALLSRIHHRNLVPLIGYCEEQNQRILIYEYMHNGTLRDHIHGSVNHKRLDWMARLQVAEDAAKGLEYLHTGCNPSIIHRDVKTSNILLDINMRAKVSDFGLSRQAEEDLTHVSSVARGTVGYLDPEYYANQQLTEKSDVYSFGVVLLELISGKKPVSTEDFGAELNIVHWARALIRKGDVMSIMDSFLIGNAKIESVWRVAEVAIQCVELRSVLRPKMQEIIVAIQEAVKIEKGFDGNQKLIGSDGSSTRGQSSRKTLLTSFLEIDQSPDLSNSNGSGFVPSAR